MLKTSIGLKWKDPFYFWPFLLEMYFSIWCNWNLCFNFWQKLPKTPIVWYNASTVLAFGVTVKHSSEHTLCQWNIQTHGMIWWCRVPLPRKCCRAIQKLCSVSNTYAPSICLAKIFFPMLKKYIFVCEMDGKWLLSHGQFFSTAKKSFSILVPSKYEFFSLGKKFLSETI